MHQLLQAARRASEVIQLFTALWRDLSAVNRRRLQVALVVMTVGSIATSAVPLIVGMFVDTIFERGQVALGPAVVPMLALLGTLVLISVTEVVRHQLVHMVTTEFNSDTRQRIYAALLRWDLEKYIDGSRGAIYGRANRSVEGAERLIKLGAADLLPAVTVAVFAIVVALARYGTIGIAMALVVPTGAALVAWQVRSQNGIRVRINAAKERIDGTVTGWLGLLDVIRTAGTERFFDEQVREDCDDLRRTELRHHIAMSQFDVAKSLNEALWLIVTLVVAISTRPDMSAGEMTGIVLLFLAVTKPLRELHRVIDEAAESALQAQNLHADLAMPIDQSFDGGATVNVVSTSQAPMLELRDVIFRYPGSKNGPVLRGVDLEVAEGERIGIVGASGCGKSTLLTVLARLSHGAEGQINLLGRPLTTYGRDELVSVVGYVPQKPQLFRGTIRENLVMGRESISDYDLARACSRANIHSDILQMPAGYDTLIGEEGAKLSGGQRQRLCLARSLLRTPPLMLLDEPTSALDGRSQTTVQEAIDGLCDVTMLIVAHRLNTLQRMDRILVLEGGRIVEDGTYDELARVGGSFSAMLESEQRKAA